MKFLAEIHGSEHSTDFCKPLTVEALRRFDPELELVFNTRLNVFQVFHLVNRPAKWSEPRLVWVCDWEEGLKGSDNPVPLLAYLKSGDTGPEAQESDRIQAEREAEKEAYDEKVQADADDNFEHALRDNRRTLLRVLQPARDLTGFVR